MRHLSTHSFLLDWIFATRFFMACLNFQCKKLQLIQNAAARVLTFSHKSEHITPILRTLQNLATHWAKNSLAPTYVLHPCLSLSFSTVRRQVVLGLPLFLFPSGFHPRATAQSLFASFLRTCPIQHHLLLLTSSLIGSAPAISSTSLFGTCCSHLMWKILLRHMVWKILSFFSSPFVIFHVSQP